MGSRGRHPASRAFWAYRQVILRASLVLPISVCESCVHLQETIVLNTKGKPPGSSLISL